MNDNTLYLSCLSEFPFLHFQQTKFLVRAIVRTSMFHDEYLKNRSEKEVVVFTSWLLLTTSGSGRILASSYGLTRSNPESVVVLNVLKGPQTYAETLSCAMSILRVATSAGLHSVLRKCNFDSCLKREILPTRFAT